MMWSDNPAVFLGLGLLLRLVLRPLLRLFLRHSFMLPLNHAEHITQLQLYCACIPPMFCVSVTSRERAEVFSFFSYFSQRM